MKMPALLSIVSLWEIAIKINLNKLTLGVAFEEFQDYLIINNFEILNLEFSHLKKISILSHHHKDPFDRLLIAQAISENLTIISADRHFDAYPVNVIW
jgi:PIN domain nuclease of toxin-antitoxin system